MFLTRALNGITDAVLAVIYPQACTLCGTSVESRGLGVACGLCWSNTRLFGDDAVVCWKCGAASIKPLSAQNPEQILCRHCNEEWFSAARSCGAYQGALRASVLALKTEPQISAYLAELLRKVCSRDPLHRASRVIPVPLHPKRQKARGFNQAAVIAQALTRHTALPLDEVSLLRVSHSERHRAGMDARGRRETVSGAFLVRYPSLITGEHVLLVDDVFTTGATVSACAEVLLKSGAAEVFVLTIARVL
jgi:ComF family protein